MDMHVNIDVGEKLVEKIAGAVEIVYDPRGDKKTYREFVRNIFRDIGEDKSISYEEKIGIVHTPCC